MQNQLSDRNVPILPIVPNKESMINSFVKYCLTISFPLILNLVKYINMNFIRIFNLLIFSTILSCSKQKDPKINQEIEGITKTDGAAQNIVKVHIDTLFIDCDSIYKGKGYHITHIMFDPYNEDDKINNSVIIFEKLVKSTKLELFRDTIFSTVQQIQFIDYNNDKMKDILVQNEADVRSNGTFYLYLFDARLEKLKRVKGFEGIKNPIFNPKYNLIENEVMSGINWTAFYKLQGDTIFDYGIVIDHGPDKNGNDHFEKDYTKAINKIRKKEKYRYD